MAAALQRLQLNKLCSSSETFDKAQSLLHLATARTRPGSGFVVKTPAALPAVCAYLASEQLNMGEVSLQSAMAAACVKKTEFNDILKKVHAALNSEETNPATDVTYEALVDAYRVHPREHAIACMEDAEGALQHVHLLKERYGADVLSCAIFYWVCQLMEETAVREQTFLQAYSIPPRPFKAAVVVLDRQCDGVADQIKTYLLQQRSAARASTSEPSHVLKPVPISPQKSPVKSALRPRTATRKLSAPVTTPSKKRTVAFSHLSEDGDVGNDDSKSFPETPTKRRRIDTSSPAKATPGISPAKRPSAAAFHAALKGGPIKPSVIPENGLPVAGPSTPRRTRRATASETTATPVQAVSQSSPSRPEGQASPTRRAVRRRFRPVFLEQQQWCARDPKVERMWAAATTLWDEMVEVHGHPFRV